jgi:uncharacterized protein (TIGR03086 family)
VLHSGAMSTLISDYQTNADRFGAVIDAANDADWSAPSPCEEWTAASVVDHVVDTQRDFLDKRGAEVGPRPSGNAQDVWAAHQEMVRRATKDEEFVSAEYDGYFGRTSVADTLANFYGFDMLVHRWDLATAVGQDTAWTEAELDRIETALDAFGDALYTDGVCKPAIDVPEDAPRQVRLLGRMGRRA